MQNIMVNGDVRPMTNAEYAQYQQDIAAQPPEPPTDTIEKIVSTMEVIV